jgi:hypothetical protein
MAEQPSPLEPDGQPRLEGVPPTRPPWRQRHRVLAFLGATLACSLVGTTALLLGNIAGLALDEESCRGITRIVYFVNKGEPYPPFGILIIWSVIGGFIGIAAGIAVGTIRRRRTVLALTGGVIGAVATGICNWLLAVDRVDLLVAWFAVVVTWALVIGPSGAVAWLSPSTTPSKTRIKRLVVATVVFGIVAVVFALLASSWALRELLWRFPRLLHYLAGAFWGSSFKA